MKKRLPYIVLLVLIVAVEVWIALTQHGWLRNHGGDVIVVWAVYCFVQSVLGGRNNHYIVHLGVMLFAFMVEFLQYFHIVDLIGLGDIQFFRVLIGTTFVPEDLLCYAAGTAIACVGTMVYNKIWVTEKSEA